MREGRVTGPRRQGARVLVAVAAWFAILGIASLEHTTSVVHVRDASGVLHHAAQAAIDCHAEGVCHLHQGRRPGDLDADPCELAAARGPIVGRASVVPASVVVLAGEVVILPAGRPRAIVARFRFAPKTSPPRA